MFIFFYARFFIGCSFGYCVGTGEIGLVAGFFIFLCASLASASFSYTLEKLHAKLFD